MEYAIITDNEVRVREQSYDNSVGEYYTFPHKYKSWLKEGTIVIYYKSKKQPDEKVPRLSSDAHYFAVAQVDTVGQKPIEKIGNKYIYLVTLTDFKSFPKAVPFRKQDGSHFEKYNTEWDKAHCHDGVRKIDESIFNSIVSQSGLSLSQSYGRKAQPSQEGGNNVLSSVFIEGRKIKAYSTKYERDPRIRKHVLEKKGFQCCVCKMSFEKTYGEIGREFIHVHHNKPLFTGERISVINDFDVVCPNCHAMIHRQPGKCLTVEELKKLFDANH